MDRVRVHDRVAGRTVESVVGRVAMGRYVFVAGGTGRTLNGRPVTAGDYLAADEEWRLRSEASGEVSVGGHGPAPLPDDLTVEWARSTGRDVSALSDRAAPLVELQRLPPILDDERARAVLAPQPLEARIGEHLRYLQAVCFRPAARLRPIDLMLPVSAARRITPRTVVRLAARSEDWAQRTPEGVRPERVLAPLREIDHDLYENRVAARLTDHVGRYLDARVAAVNDIGDWILGVGHYLRQVQTGDRHWQISERLYGLLSELMETDWAERVGQRLAELEGLRGPVRGLRASPLWRSVNRRGALDTALRTTNLFVNDDRYRHVAALWRAWVAAEVHSQSADDRWQRVQEWCHGFTAYAVLLLTRACEEVGLRPEPDQPVPARGCATVYRTGPGVVKMNWRREDVIVLERDGRPTLRVVPLPHALAASRDDGTVVAELDGLDGGPDDVPTVVLYPGARAEREELSPAVRLRAFEGPGSPAPGRPSRAPYAVPVSALEVDSLGRVARALRWAVWGRRLTEYPVRVETAGLSSAGLAAGTSFVRADRTGVTMTKVPSVDEADALDERVQSLRQDTSRFMRRGDNSEQIAGLRERIADAIDRTRGLTWCPKCGRQSSSPERALVPRGNGTYTCTCDHCGSMWETRRCPNCNGRSYPVLVAPAAGDAELNGHGDRLDELLAGDMLSAPCWIRARVYICPACSTCPEADSKDTRGCARCGTAAVALETQADE